MKKIIVSLSIISPLLFAFNCTTSVPLVRPSSKVSDIAPSIVNYSPNNGSISNPSSSPSSTGKITVDQSQKIAFMSNRSGFWDIYNMNIDGSNVQKITRDDMKSPFAFSVSPDGQKIAYISDKTGNSDLWIMNLITKEVTQITDTPLGDEGSPSWSADSQRVAFHSNSSGKLYKILQVNYPFIKGQNSIQTLISDVANSSLHPSFSPDGNKILYSFIDTTAGTTVLHIYDYLTKKDSPATTNKEQPINGSWSPDSNKIIYWTGNNGIFQVNVNLTGRIAIGTLKDIKGTPFFSPDGKKIAIARGYGFSEDYNVWIMDNDGRNPQKISNDGGISLNWYKVSNSSSSPVITPSNPVYPTSSPTSNTSGSGSTGNPYVDPNDPLLNP